MNSLKPGMGPLSKKKNRSCRPDIDSPDMDKLNIFYLESVVFQPHSDNQSNPTVIKEARMDQSLNEDRMEIESLVL